MYSTIKENLFPIVVIVLILCGVSYGSYLVYQSYKQTTTPEAPPTIERYQIDIGPVLTQPSNG